MDRSERRALRPDRGARLALFIGLFLFAAAAFPAQAGAAGCPESDFRFGAAPPVTSTAAQRDTTFGPTGGCDHGAASWDLAQGTFALDQRPCLASSSECVVQDTYTVTGLPPGTPVLVFAFLDVHADTPVLCGGMGCEVDFHAMLAHPLATDSNNWSTPGPADFRLQVLVVTTAGTPFPLRSEFALPFCGGGSEGRLEGHLSFLLLDMTQGSVTSCNGFAGPVSPAAPSSWGRVKATYR